MRRYLDSKKDKKESEVQPMLIKAQKAITQISNDEAVNMQNYMESLSYVSNLYTFIGRLKTAVDNIDDVVFLPSFYGRMSCSGLFRDMSYCDKEAEMKVLKLSSPLFLVDKSAKDVMSKMMVICDDISLDQGIMTFILK